MGAIRLKDLEMMTGKTFSDEEKKRMRLHIEAVNRWIEGYTGRVFGDEKTFEVVLDYDPVVFLPHVDITSIEYVEVRGTKLKEFIWNSQGRIVLSTTGTSFKGDRDDYDQVISSASTGGYSVTYGSGTGAGMNGSQSGSGVGEQGSVAMILNAYRLRRV